MTRASFGALPRDHIDVGISSRALRAIVIAMLRLSLLAFLLFLLVACRDAAAPPPPTLTKIHAGGCTIVWKWWMDRADHTKGAIVLRVRVNENESCPDELTVVWDDELQAAPAPADTSWKEYCVPLETEPPTTRCVRTPRY